MYRSRDFTMAMVSVNAPDEKDDVMRVLNREHASTRNLLFNSEDAYKLQAAFDEKWDSGVPYTMLIAPDGKELYRKQGEIDILEMRRAILRNLPTAYPGFRNYWLQQ